jgi:hypothetical protein
MTVQPRSAKVGQVLRLAYWNADGVRGRKLGLDQFLRQHGVYSCLLNETRFVFAAGCFVRLGVETERSLPTGATTRCQSRVCKTWMPPPYTYVSVNPQAQLTPDRVEPDQVSDGLDGGRLIQCRRLKPHAEKPRRSASSLGSSYRLFRQRGPDAAFC